jgi:hypothetical protein
MNLIMIIIVNDFRIKSFIDKKGRREYNVYISAKKTIIFKKEVNMKNILGKH